MVLMVMHYHNKAIRALHTILIEAPIQLWYRFLVTVIPSNKRFINNTSIPDSVLEEKWSEAQKLIGSQAFPLTSAYNGPTHAADPRALTLQPENITVVECEDELVSNLVKAQPSLSDLKDPSGAILSNPGGGPVVAFTYPWKRPRVYAAKSKVEAVLNYEFANIILKRLGYDVTNR